MDNIRFKPRNFDTDLTRDLQEVDQFGFVNLNEAYEKGIIPGGIQFDEESFNGVSNPGTLIPRASDIFDGLRKAEYVKASLASLSAEEREKVEKQVVKASEAAGDVTS